jgi:hypothetical protein
MAFTTLLSKVDRGGNKDQIEVKERIVPEKAMPTFHIIEGTMRMAALNAHM